MTRIDTGPLLPGQPIRLHGQGFSPHGRISFLFDGTQPLLDNHGISDSTQADAQGVFPQPCGSTIISPGTRDLILLMRKTLLQNTGLDFLSSLLKIPLAKAPLGPNLVTC